MFYRVVCVVVAVCALLLHAQSSRASGLTVVIGIDVSGSTAHGVGMQGEDLGSWLHPDPNRRDVRLKQAVIGALEQLDLAAYFLTITIVPWATVPLAPVVEPTFLHEGSRLRVVEQLREFQANPSGDTRPGSSLGVLYDRYGACAIYLFVTDAGPDDPDYLRDVLTWVLPTSPVGIFVLDHHKQQDYLGTFSRLNTSERYVVDSLNPLSLASLIPRMIEGVDANSCPIA